MKVWQAKLQTSLQQAANTVTTLSDTARVKALAGGAGFPAAGVLGSLGGSFTGKQGAGSQQQCVQVTPEAAQKIRWFEKEDLASLAQQHSKEKQELWAINVALKQLLVQHGVPESALEEELSFHLGEMEKLRLDDEHVYAVLLEGAHQEVQALKSLTAAAGGGPAHARPRPGTPPSPSPVALKLAQDHPLQKLREAAKQVADTPLKSEGEAGSAVAGVPVSTEAMQKLAQAVEELDEAWPTPVEMDRAVRELQFHARGEGSQPGTPRAQGGADAAALAAQLKRAEEECAQASESCAALQQRVSALEAQLAGEAEAAAAAQAKAAGLAAELERTQKEAEGALQDMRVRLNKSVQEHVQVLKQAQEICKSAEDRASSMERRSDMFEVRAGQASAEAKDAKEEIKRLQAELKRLQRDSGRVEAAGRLQARSRQLEEEAAASAKTIASLQLSNEQLERRVAELEAAEAQLSTELAEAEEQVAAHETLTLRVVGLEERLKDAHLLREQLSAARSLVAELEAKRSGQEDELVTTAQLATRLEGRLARAQAELEQHKTQAQAAELRALKAEQGVADEVVRRLAAAGRDRGQWPAPAVQALEAAEQQASELRAQVDALQRDVVAAGKAREHETQQKALLQQKVAAAEERLHRVEWEGSQRAGGLERQLAAAREEIEEARRAIALVEQQAKEAQRAAAAAAAAAPMQRHASNGSVASTNSKQYGGGSLLGMGDKADVAAPGAGAAGPPREAVAGVDVLYLKNVLLKFLDAYVHGRSGECAMLLPAVATVVRASPQEFHNLKASIEAQQGWGPPWAALGLNFGAAT